MTMSFVTKIIFDWGVRCFGLEHLQNKQERALRLVEEAIELCQSVNVPKEKVQLAIDIVYSRPHGVPLQELGGVLVCAHAFSAGQISLGNTSTIWDIDRVLEREVHRVLNMNVEGFKQRNEAKKAAGLRSDPDLHPRRIIQDPRDFKVDPGGSIY